MGAKHISKDKSQDNQNNSSDDILKYIKSNYVLKKIYDNLKEKKKLQIVKYNKKILNRLNLNVKDYKKYRAIEIEIVACDHYAYVYGKFININENDEEYYHIYFNDNKEEIKNKYEIYQNDKVKKIKIIIDDEVRSLEKLFENCFYIESINFKKFNRNNINNMSNMFIIKGNKSF